MDAKFVIFVFISTFLIAAFYSSHAFVQFAFSSYERYCAQSGKKSICINVSGNDVYIANCTEDSAGEWHCQVEGVGPYARESSLPPDLKNALDTAIDTATKGSKHLASPKFNDFTLLNNHTKVPNTDVLKDNGILEGTNNNDNNTSDDNVKEPKAPKVPEDLGGLNDNGG